ncbi:MAG: zf-HC2 domain-containing protein [Terriglobales bacterium]
MTCNDVQQVLPEIMDGSEDAEFRAHLESCPSCAELFAELNLIVSESHGLAQSEEPPDRIWVQVANQLRAEGIILDPGKAPGRPVLLPAPTHRLSPWWFAPVAAALILAGAYRSAHRQIAPQPPQVAQIQTAHDASANTSQPATQPQQLAQKSSDSPSTGAAEPSAQVAQVQVAQVQASNPAAASVAHPAQPADNPQIADNTSAEREIAPPSSADDQRFLTQVSEGSPGMRTTYENQLHAVNAEIRETQQYIRQHPGDVDARQHLLEAFQQKTMLYQMALDRIQ